MYSTTYFYTRFYTKYLIIKTYIKETLNKGIGLFSNQFIKQGEIMWIYENNFIKRYTLEEFNKMEPLQKEFLEHYGVIEFDGMWLLDLDDTRFINHSNDPNVKFDSENTLANNGKALKDIKDMKDDVKSLMDFKTRNDNLIKIGIWVISTALAVSGVLVMWLHK